MISWMKPLGSLFFPTSLSLRAFFVDPCPPICKPFTPDAFFPETERGGSGGLPEVLKP